MEHIGKIIPQVMAKIKPKEFQIQHGLTDEELDFVKHVCVSTKGTVSGVTDKKEEQIVIKKKNAIYTKSKSRSFYKGQWNRETSR